MRWEIRFLVRTAILLALTLVIQFAGLPQPFTGPAVNAMLILSTIFVGPFGAIIIGCLTPWLAFLRGIMGFAPLIPYIMVANAVYVIAFYLVRQSLKKVVRIDSEEHFSASINGILSGGAGVITGAVLKFLVLSSAVKFFIADVKPKMAQMMQLPQLITALTGGAIALLVAAALVKSGALKEWQKNR